MKFILSALVIFAIKCEADSLRQSRSFNEDKYNNNNNNYEIDSSAATEPLLHPMPPNPKPYQVTYEDGTVSPQIYIKMFGDEASSSHTIYEETSDGFTVTLVGGKYEYMDVDETSFELYATGLVAGVDDPYNSEIKKGTKSGQHLLKHAATEKRKRIANRDERKLLHHDLDRTENMRRYESTGHPNRRKMTITSGTLKNLVIPVRFSNHVSRSLPSRNKLDILMNNEGPDDLVCPTGSVRDVYLESSFNQLDLESTVVVWVTIDYTESYCADGNFGLSSRFHTCLRDALDKVVARGTDLRDFDLNNDGFIDGITFLHSGYGAEWGGSNNDRIWSHKWALYTQEWSSNGVRVYDYHISPGIWGTAGSEIGRVGVLAHETGHFLGLPDLYDYGGGDGIGSYGLMANSWGFDSSQLYPPHMSAWGKYELGWVNPTIVSTSGTYSLRQACNHGDMIKITEGYPSGEYLLIENRQPCDFDGQMPQGGLAIFHIDESANNIRGYPDQDGWPGNGNHYNVALLQADGYYDLERGYNRGDSGDLFHSGYVDEIGPNGVSGSIIASYPNTKAYQNGNIIDASPKITNISSAGYTMTFDICFGSCSTSPVATPTASSTDAPNPSPVQNFAPCKNPNFRRLKVTVQTDSWASETSFKVKRQRNGKFRKVVWDKNNFEANTLHEFSKCLPKNRCYKLLMFDSFGDGMCCADGHGYYDIKWKGTNIWHPDEFDNGFKQFSGKFGRCK